MFKSKTLRGMLLNAAAQAAPDNVREYDERFTEVQVPHSTALHSLLADGGLRNGVGDFDQIDSNRLS